jgi:hypothetical protein
MSETKEKPLTPEEYEEAARKTEEFLDKKLPLLRKQAEYEELLFKIKNYGYSREVIDVKWAEHRAQQGLMKAQRETEVNKGGNGGAH